MRIKIALIILCTFAVGRLGYDSLFGIGISGVPPQRPFSEFPTDAAGKGWKGWNVTLDREVVRKAGVSQYIKQHYLYEGFNFSFYVGYYNGSTVDSIHQPEVCFPGAGFRLKSRDVVTFHSDWSKELRFNLLQFEKDRRQNLTAYTFYYRGLFEPKESVIYRGRAFSSRYYAILIISVDFLDRDEMDRARALLANLIAAAVPRLEEFFPLETVKN